MKNELTKKQKIIYDHIKEFINCNKYSPTIRELCKLCGLNSTATMYVHLQKIKAKGYINYIDKQARTITILGDKE